MKIIAYRSEEYRNTDTFETDEIFGNFEPDEITDEDRKQLREGAEPMCCFSDENSMHCIPWKFIISISE